MTRAVLLLVAVLLVWAGIVQTAGWVAGKTVLGGESTC